MDLSVEIIRLDDDDAKPNSFGPHFVPLAGSVGCGLAEWPFLEVDTESVASTRGAKSSMCARRARNQAERQAQSSGQSKDAFGQKTTRDYAPAVQEGQSISVNASATQPVAGTSSTNNDVAGKLAPVIAMIEAKLEPVMATIVGLENSQAALGKLVLNLQEELAASNRTLRETQLKIDDQKRFLASARSKAQHYEARYRDARQTLGLPYEDVDDNEEALGWECDAYTDSESEDQTSEEESQ